jgi:hypothetical protein
MWYKYFWKVIPFNKRAFYEHLYSTYCNKDYGKLSYKKGRVNMQNFLLALQALVSYLGGLVLLAIFFGIPYLIIKVIF